MTGSSRTILRFGHHHEHRKDIFLQFIINHAFDVEYRMPLQSFTCHNLWSKGIGATLLSPVGPMNVVVSQGDGNFTGWRSKQTARYFTPGYKF
jgi:hypothetical protein